jgi:hypothetical protein
MRGLRFGRSIRCEAATAWQVTRYIAAESHLEQSDAVRQRRVHVDDVLTAKTAADTTQIVRYNAAPLTD